MKIVLSTLLLLLGAFSLYSQKYDSLKDSWDRIIINDSNGGWASFDKQYEIKRVNGELILVNEKDSTIKKIEPDILRKFFESLETEKNIEKDPLQIFGKDSTWLINNAKKLWLSYSSRKNRFAEIDSFAIRKIKDYGQVKHLIKNLQGFAWTDDYPSTAVTVIKNSDTLGILSFGQYPFMMPWIVGTKIHHNAELPTALAEILPENVKSNKSRLNGDNFDEYLIRKIYTTFIEKHHEYFTAKKRYPSQFNFLEQHYFIDNAELMDMSSIEWSNFISAPCLVLKLKSKKLPENIEMGVVYRTRIKLHAVRPIIKKQGNILTQLNDNPVYQYTIKTPTSLGEIHLVNNKSLSGIAKRNFKTDLKDNRLSKNSFRGRYKHAIFYELTEKREKEESFSRWVFLKDGTIILWQIDGNFLMDLNPEIIKEKGYICRVITNNEFGK